MSEISARLVPLVCLKCSAPVTAGVSEVAWVCATCGQGHLLDEEKGLRAIEVFFHQTLHSGGQVNTMGRPFWVSRGQVRIDERATFKGDESRAAREFWSAPRLFYVPAWECGIEELVQTGSQMLRSPVAMQPGPAGRFLPVVTPPGDLPALAEFMVVSLEAERRDALKTINFSLSLEPAQLWVMP